MRLDLRMIKNVPDKRLDFSYQLTGLDCRGLEQTPFNVTGSVRNASGVLMLEGRMEGVLSLVCDRCDDRFEREKTLNVSGVLSDSPDGEDDNEVFTYDGAGVELDNIFISEFILDTDMKILCSNDCDGGGKYLYFEKDE